MVSLTFQSFFLRMAWFSSYLESVTNKLLQFTQEETGGEANQNPQNQEHQHAKHPSDPNDQIENHVLNPPDNQTQVDSKQEISNKENTKNEQKMETQQIMNEEKKEIALTNKKTQENSEQSLSQHPQSTSPSENSENNQTTQNSREVIQKAESQQSQMSSQQIIQHPNQPSPQPDSNQSLFSITGELVHEFFSPLAIPIINSIQHQISKFQMPEGISEEEVLDLAISPSLKEFVVILTQNPTIFSNFPDPSAFGNAKLNHRQLYHINMILQEIPDLNKVRFSLCPKILTDDQFWHIYFVLIQRKVGAWLQDQSQWLPPNPLRDDKQYKQSLVFSKQEVAVKYVWVFI